MGAPAAIDTFNAFNGCWHYDCPKIFVQVQIYGNCPSRPDFRCRLPVSTSRSLTPGQNWTLRGASPGRRWPLSTNAYQHVPN